MEQFTSKISEIIENNSELKDNTILRSVLEGLKYTGDSLQFLNELKGGLTDVNQYLNNDDIKSIIVSVDSKIDEVNKTDINGFIIRESNEFDMVSLIDSVKSNPEIKDPRITGYLGKLLEECNTGRYPSYLYINNFVQTMTEYSEFTAVKESIDTAISYINENQEKLILLDTINYISSLGSGANKKVLETLKTCVFESQFNPDVISLRLGTFAKDSNVANMLESLRSVRNDKNPEFDLGDGNNGTEVFSYVGPVLREGKSSLTLYVDGSFIHISPNSLDESLVKKTISDGPVKIYEMDELNLFNTDREFYNMSKAYEALGFQLKKGGVESKLKRNTVEFKINEDSNLDLIMNSQKIEDISKAKSSDTLIFENQGTKQCLFNIFENVDSIYNLNFVKFFINENKGAAMVINIKDDYFVYDFVSENQTDVYKFDGYKLYEFALTKFGYDISSTFKLQINDAVSKVKRLEESKKVILDTIAGYKDSVSKIDETLSKKISDEEKTSILELKTKISDEIKRLEESYIVLCEQVDAVAINGDDKVNENSLESDVAEDEKVEGEQETTQTEETQTETEENDETINECSDNDDNTSEGSVPEEEGSGETVDDGVMEGGEPEENTEDVSGDQMNESSEKKNDQSEASNLNETADNDEFKAGGVYEDVNSKGYEIMVSEDGKNAKIKTLSDGSISDWLLIEFSSNDTGVNPVIDPNGFNIPLNKVKRVNENRSDLRSVTVTYDDGTVIPTSMAAHLTDDEIREYFAIGKEFNIGDGPNDKMAKVSSVEIEPKSESENVDIIEFKIPVDYAAALVNADTSGLSDEDEAELNTFVNNTVEQFGNANFMIITDEKSQPEFCDRNDVNSLGSDCITLGLRPDKTQSKQIVEFMVPDWAVSALISEDKTGMSEEQIQKLGSFLTKMNEQYSNTEFSLDENEDVEFLETNDISEGANNCVKMTLIDKSK